jgi:hypothetical protein
MSAQHRGRNVEAECELRIYPSPPEEWRQVWLVESSTFVEEPVERKISRLSIAKPGSDPIIQQIQSGDLLVCHTRGTKHQIMEVLLLVDEPPQSGRPVTVYIKQFEEHPPVLLDALIAACAECTNPPAGGTYLIPADVLHRIRTVQPEVSMLFARPRHWVFQCNPRLYDLKQAVRRNHLKTWKVTAHKQRIKKGDKVIMWMTGSEAGCYALATVRTEVFKGWGEMVEADYFHVDDLPEAWDRCEIEIDLDLTAAPILRKTTEADPVLAGLKVGMQGTNFQATPAQYQQLLRLALSERRGMMAKVALRYSLADFCADTGYAEEEVNRWLRAIQRKGQVIFGGPPGTGKTYVAERLARLLTSEGNGFYEMVQFHPNYAYEDFIQGIRPVVMEDARQKVELVPGRFLEFCERARSCGGTCVMVIDEINRAHLPRVLGELMLTLEYREIEIPLAGGNRFSIPKGVRLIGTMNTADRSIALLDVALRRRFAFIRLSPQYEQLRRFHHLRDNDVEGLILLLQEINERVGDPSFALGISYFMVENLAEELEEIWKWEVEPYLEDVLFDQPDSAASYCWERVKGRLLP